MHLEGDEVRGPTQSELHTADINVSGTKVSNSNASGWTALDDDDDDNDAKTALCLPQLLRQTEL